MINSCFHFLMITVIIKLNRVGDMLHPCLTPLLKNNFRGIPQLFYIFIFVRRYRTWIVFYKFVVGFLDLPIRATIYFYLFHWMLCRIVEVGKGHMCLCWTRVVLHFLLICDNKGIVCKYLYLIKQFCFTKLAVLK